MTPPTTGPSGADADRAGDRPERSSLPASCPWCRRRFATTVALLDHVDRWHLRPEPAAA